MGKRQKPFVADILRDGTKTERDFHKAWVLTEAKKLADKMPTGEADRCMFVRNLTFKALRKEVDREVFEMFVKLTGSWMEVETCLPRARLLARRK